MGYRHAVQGHVHRGGATLTKIQCKDSKALKRGSRETAGSLEVFEVWFKPWEA